MKNYARHFFIFGLLIFCLCGAGTVNAQNPNPDITRRELASFDRFLSDHPWIAAALHRNPRLIDEPHYVAKHPGLQEYLMRHPEVREELRETPRYFEERALRLERRNVTHGELQRFDKFLDAHPGIAEDLTADPAIADNRAYLAAHPELAEFLRTHPGIRSELAVTPNYFMKRETRYDRREERRELERRYGRRNPPL
jgi:hypothetical protein